MTTEDRFQRLKQAAAKGAKVAVIVVILAILMGTSPLRVIALWAAIVLFFTAPSIVIILSDLIAERRLIIFDDVGVEERRPFGGHRGTTIVWLSLTVQLALFSVLVQHEPGEKLGYSSLLITTFMVFSSLGVILPGTLISLIRTIVAITKLKIDNDAKHQFVLNLFITLMPLFFTWQLQQQSKPAPVKQEPVRNVIQQKSDQRVEGRLWAQEEGISGEDACNKNSPEFAKGCKSYVKQPHP